MPGVLVDFSMFLKEKGWYFAKSLFEETKAAGWIAMQILETPVLLGLMDG